MGREHRYRIERTKMEIEQGKDDDNLTERRQDRGVERGTRIREEASKRRGRGAGKRLGEGNGSKAQDHPKQKTERDRGRWQSRDEERYHQTDVPLVSRLTSLPSSGPRQQRSGSVSTSDDPWSYWAQNQV